MNRMQFGPKGKYFPFADGNYKIFSATHLISAGVSNYTGITNRDSNIEFYTYTTATGITHELLDNEGMFSCTCGFKANWAKWQSADDFHAAMLAPFILM